MRECEQTPKVHAYHDDELSAESRRAIEEHLRGCDACAAELSFLKQAHEGIASAPVPPLPADLIRNVKDQIAYEPFRPVLRLAWWLTAGAAAVVVICVSQLAQNTSAATDPPPTWEVLATAGDEPASPVSDELQLARWFVQDLSATKGGRP